MNPASQTEMLIVDWREGDRSARDRLIARLLPELEQIAAARLRREAGTSLSTHDLINDAVERLLKIDGESVASRAHFVALASRLMRNILVDNARARSAGKRQHRRVELTTRVEGAGKLDLHLLDSALIRLGAVEPALMELVEMRYFGGMSIGDIAQVTGWSEPTVKRRWRVARAWLADALSQPLPEA
jgi:RNA polymerase sigma factor (TIGR02999 family)